MKIAFGGGCHWCTEAVFQSLKGIEKVEQGFVASTGSDNSFSEAIIVYFDPSVIPLKILIEIHLYTHKSTSQHSMRGKYRSAIYVFSDTQSRKAILILKKLQEKFEHKLITKVYPFGQFKPTDERFANYYYNNPDKPFCQSYINPKLQLLLERFKSEINQEKLPNLT